MKCFIKTMMLAIAICTGSGVNAQTAIASTDNPSALAAAKTPAETEAKEITLTIKNDCMGAVFFFAGSKKKVFDGHGQSIGGHGTDVLYLREGDMVCIMRDPKTIQACAVAKPGTTKVEINSSGNGFVK